MHGGHDGWHADLEEQPGKEQFRNAVRSLRGALRPHLGDTDAKIIEPAGPMFRAEADLLDVDLWTFQHQLHETARAPDDTAAITALSAAASLYRGDLLDGLYHEWAAPEREHLRRQAVDALTRLADLAERLRQPDDALNALEQAIRVDPYEEALYQRAIRLHGRLAQPDAARRLFRQLETRLLELDVEASEETEALVAEATGSPRRPVGTAG